MRKNGGEWRGKFSEDKSLKLRWVGGGVELNG